MTTTKKGFTLYIDQVNQQRSTYSTALSGVLSYKNIDGNLISSLFVDAQNINQTTIDQTISDIQQRKDFLQSMTDDLLTDVSLNEHQKAFIQRTIEHTICAYSLLQEATRIEAQKSGMQIAPRLLNKARKNIHKYETYLYGKKISQIPEEKNKVLLHCIHMLQHNKNKIKSDEYHDFLVFLQTQYKEAIPSIVRLKSPSVPINNKHISAEQLAYIFFLVCRIFGQNTVCILYTKVKKPRMKNSFTFLIPYNYQEEDIETIFLEKNILQHTKIILHPHVENISAGKNAVHNYITLKIPQKETYTLQRVCELIDHEIVTHVLRSQAALQNNLNIKLADYIQTEEGVALMNERLVTQDITEISMEPSIHHIASLIGEVCTFDQTKRLLYIWGKLLGHSNAQAEIFAQSKTQRAKRFHQFDDIGSNRKDTSYRRGMQQIVGHIRTLNTQQEVDTFLKHVYIGKFSLQDFPLLGELFEGMGAIESVMPLAIGRYLYQKTRKQSGRLSFPTYMTREQKILFSRLVRYTKRIISANPQELHVK